MYDHETIVDDDRLRVHLAVVHSTIEYTPPHWHNHIEVLLMLDGVMHVEVDDRTYDLKERDIFFINSRAIHATHTHTDAGYLLLQIPKEDVRRLLPDYDSLYIEEYHPFRQEGVSSRLRMGELLRAIQIEYEKRVPGFRLIVTSYVYRFLFELYTHHSVPLSDADVIKRDKGLDRIELAMDFVKANYRRPLCVQDVSGMLGIRREYFCRLFRKYTNRTFLEYVNTVRLVHFYYDLLHTKDSVAALLEKNGITNYKVFIRMFRQAYGATPMKIRAEQSL